MTERIKFKQWTLKSMGKKGQAEQFNWIFVIISGAIILGFFAMFTFQYIDLQDKRQNLDSLRFFGNVLGIVEKIQVGDAGSSVKSTDKQGLRFGYDVILSYYCSEGDAKILIEGTKKSDFIPTYSLKDEIVFTEEKQKVNGINMGLLPWNFPYQITNFIYLSDPKKIYIFAYDSGSEEFLNKLEEDNSVIFDMLKSEKVMTSQIKAKEHSRIIIFSKQKPTESRIKDLKGSLNDLSFIHVDFENKKVSFFEEGKWSQGITYYGNEMMLGGIFTNNKDNYECNVKKATKRLKDLTTVYIERTRIVERLDNRPECHYQLIENSLAEFQKGKFSIIDSLVEQNNKGAGCLWVF